MTVLAVVHRAGAEAASAAWTTTTAHPNTPRTSGTKHAPNLRHVEKNLIVNQSDIGRSRSRQRNAPVGTPVAGRWTRSRARGYRGGSGIRWQGDQSDAIVAA